ncbi:class I SAM-dependent methyltransferase [Mucilaginibacter aquariorum]|uniref:Class I SAM-dependent methyltransferase n=1 Tax=Mucilaginibacter aquariorum TaxID=2967225 RepID=A0ABT1T378_9SPHI|nr:class I SAM-dependent methyltransferase [Mucilaginibacter aquariorum]MCQ6959072.1 class I SAM-dependent methyltransferase [Mucilaginibacter aquariorum]
MNTHADDTAIIPAQTTEKEFGHLYIKVREKEQRLYTDDELRQLPDIDPSHIHYKEWKIRTRSAGRLVNYLRKKQTPLNILEIGCGNGWLSSKLAGIKGAIVTGFDVNELEINQAKRVFNKINLQFFCDEFDAEKFKALSFDVVVFAASLQYFSPVKDILDRVYSHLSPQGEVHIIDTNFYTPQSIKGAAQSTLEHYTKMGCPELAKYYFHHRLDDLQGYKYKVLSNPNSIINRLRKDSPFYWICINKQ